MTELFLNIERSLDGFGFSMADQGNDNYISEVEPEGPADTSGLKVGDVVLSVNECDLSNSKTKKIIKRINKTKQVLKLKIYRKNQEIQKSNESPKVELSIQNVDEIPQNVVFEETLQTPPPPKFLEQSVNQRYSYEPKISRETSDNIPTARICHLRISENSTYGYTLFREPKVDHHFLINVVKNSPAENAGIRENDILVEVNDVNVEDMEHEILAQLLKNSGECTSLLVVDQVSYDYFIKNGIRISGSMPEIEQWTNFETIDRSSNNKILWKNSDKEYYDILDTPMILHSLPDDIIEVKNKFDSEQGKSTQTEENINIPDIINRISLM